MAMREKGFVDLIFSGQGLQTLGQIGNTITGINQGLELMQRMMGAVTSATKTFVDTGSQFERYEVQFTTLLGSIDAAQTRMEELFTFSTETPFDLPEVVESAQKLEAYGVYAEETLRIVGDAAAAMDKTLDQAVEAIADASRGELERLKEFGISSAEITKQLGHEINRGTIEGLDEIQAAVLEIMGERYGGGMAALSETLAGTISNLRFRWTEFKKEVADSKAFETVKAIFAAILNSVNQLFDEGEAQKIAQVVGKTLADAFREVVILLAQLIQGIGEQIRAYQAGGIAGAEARSSAAKTGVGGFFFGIAQKGRELLGIDYGDPNAPLAEPFAWEVAAANVEAQAKVLRQDRPSEQTMADREMGTAPEEERRYKGARGEKGDRKFFSEFYEEEFEETKELHRQSVDLFNELEDERMQKAEQRLQFSRGIWQGFFSDIIGYTEKWGELEKVRFKDIAQAMGDAAREGVAAWFGAKATEWGALAVESGIYAGVELLKGNYVAAAGYAKGAAEFGALATMYSAGAVGAMLIGKQKEYAAEAGATDSRSNVADETGTRSISKTVGIKAQNVTYNVYVIHNDPVTYGSDGIAAMTREQIIPAIREAEALGY